MRKTRLLLDAVERVGCQDVTFVALDLCEDSLGDALTALQGAQTLAASGTHTSDSELNALREPFGRRRQFCLGLTLESAA
jgi:uncharacterized SAM-dependent methyltransferase